MDKNSCRPSVLVGCGLLLAFLAGCAATPPGSAPAESQTTATASPVPPPPPPPPARRAGELALADGVEQYLQGNYAAAIKKLQESPEIWAETPAIRVEALKHMAFSACLLKQRSACRNHFDRLLEIDPAFELTPAENGHPDWTPVFRQAKQALANPTRRPAPPAPR